MVDCEVPPGNWDDGGGFSLPGRLPVSLVTARARDSGRPGHAGL